MAGYKHGVYTREVPTSIMVPVESDAALPVYYGTAPVHLASDPAAANRPVLCYNYAQIYIVRSDICALHAVWHGSDYTG